MANGSAAIVAVLAAVALFLAGCGGGGGGGDKHECVNKEYNIPTQSFTAKGTISGNLASGKLQAGATITMTTKLDRDKLNIYEVITIVNGSNTATSTTIISVENKVVATQFKASGGLLPKPVSNCTFQKRPQWDVTKDKPVVDQAIKALGELVKCSENDGTYDTFKVNQEIPFSLLNMTGYSGSVGMVNKCDKDFMLHSASINFDMKTPELPPHPPIQNTSIPPQTIHAEMQMTVDGGVAEAKGPDPTDLDYSSWGKCVEQPPKSINEFFGLVHSDAHALRSSRLVEFMSMVLDGRLLNEKPPASMVV